MSFIQRQGGIGRFAGSANQKRKTHDVKSRGMIEDATIPVHRIEMGGIGDKTSREMHELDQKIREADIELQNKQSIDKKEDELVRRTKKIADENLSEEDVAEKESKILKQLLNDDGRVRSGGIRNTKVPLNVNATDRRPGVGKFGGP